MAKCKQMQRNVMDRLFRYLFEKDSDREGGEKPVWNRADYSADSAVCCLL